MLLGDRHLAEWASSGLQQPKVDTRAMERVDTIGQTTERLTELMLAKANGTLIREALHRFIHLFDTAKRPDLSG